MLDIKLLRENPEKIIEGLKKRNYKVDLIEKLAVLDKEWREATFAIETLQKERNANSQLVAQKKKNGENTDELIFATKEIGEKIKALEVKILEITESLSPLLLELPNIPNESVVRAKEG